MAGGVTLEDMFSLRDFRVYALKMNSQGELAQLLDVEQSNISRWEKNPDSIPWSVLRLICEKTGATLEELTGWRKPVITALPMDNEWGTCIHELPILRKIKKLEQCQFGNPMMKESLEKLKKYVLELYEKPCASLIGRSDSGKSTMENALIGANRLPAAWTPTTAIPMYLKHITDKPIFITDNVLIFKERVENKTWDVRQIYDQDYVTAWRLASGDYELLKSYGSRQGEHYGEEAAAAVVFLDAPILLNCDMIDLPGFGTGQDRDDNATFKACQQTDICIYLSPANGFMQIADSVYLKRSIMELPTYVGIPDAPLFNLFVVASQAHIINNGNPTQLQEILDYGCENLLKTVPDVFWENRATIWGDRYENKELKAQLRKRFFPYTTSIPHLNQKFEDALKSTIKQIALDKRKAYDNAVAGYIQREVARLAMDIQTSHILLMEMSRSEMLINLERLNCQGRHQKVDKKYGEVCERIAVAKESSVNQCIQALHELLTAESIVKQIEEQGINNDRTEIHLFECNLQTAIVQKCQQIIERHSEGLQEYMSVFALMYDTQTSIQEDELGTYEAIQNLMKYDSSELTETEHFLKSGETLLFFRFFDKAYREMEQHEERKKLAATVGGTILASFGPVGITLGSVMLLSQFAGKRLSGKWKSKCANNILTTAENANVIGIMERHVNAYWDGIQSVFDIMNHVEDAAYAQQMGHMDSMTKPKQSSYLTEHAEKTKQVYDMYNALALELGMRSDTEWFVQKKD